MVSSTAEILEQLGLEVISDTQLKLPFELDQLYKNIRASPKTVAELPENSFGKLTQLELKGLIKRDSCGRYAAA